MNIKLSAFNDELEKDANIGSGVGKFLGSAGAAVIGAGVKARQAATSFIPELIQGAKSSFKGNAAATDRLAAKTPLFKTPEGNYAAQPVKATQPASSAPAWTGSESQVSDLRSRIAAQPVAGSPGRGAAPINPAPAQAATPVRAQFSTAPAAASNVSSPVAAAPVATAPIAARPTTGSGQPEVASAIRQMNTGSTPVATAALPTNNVEAVKNFQRGIHPTQTQVTPPANTWAATPVTPAAAPVNTQFSSAPAAASSNAEVSAGIAAQPRQVSAPTQQVAAQPQQAPIEAASGNAATPKTSYTVHNRRDREGNIVPLDNPVTRDVSAEKARRLAYMRANRPANPWATGAKVVGGGALLGGGIVGAGTIWGGLTQEPGLNNYVSGETPAPQSAYYGA